MSFLAIGTIVEGAIITTTVEVIDTRGREVPHPTLEGADGIILTMTDHRITATRTEITAGAPTIVGITAPTTTQEGDILRRPPKKTGPYHYHPMLDLKSKKLLLSYTYIHVYKMGNMSIAHNVNVYSWTTV